MDKLFNQGDTSRKRLSKPFPPNEIVVTYRDGEVMEYLVQSCHRLDTLRLGLDCHLSMVPSIRREHSLYSNGILQKRKGLRSKIWRSILSSMTILRWKKHCTDTMRSFGNADSGGLLHILRHSLRFSCERRIKNNYLTLSDFSRATPAYGRYANVSRDPR